MRFGRGFLICLGLALSHPAMAQDWITPESCAIDAAALTDAAPADTATAVLAADIPNGEGRLWQVTAPGGQVSHLWGTLHSSDPSVARPVPELARLIEDARVLLIERDPRAQDRQELSERALQFGVWLAPEHVPYDKPWLTGPAADWARARVAGIFQDPGVFATLTDAGLAFYLFADPCEDFAAGALPVQDDRLLQAALDAGVAARGLEDWDALLSDLSDPERADVARALVQVQAAYLNPEGFSQARRAGVHLYRQGRIGLMMAGDRLYLERFFGAQQGATLRHTAQDYLIAERNRRFLRIMRAELDTGGALVAVGAFHLPGKDGLVAGLRAAGYRVDRLPVAGEAP